MGDFKKRFLIELGEIFRASASLERPLSGEYVEQIKKGIELIEQVNVENAWFTKESVQSALHAWGNSLTENKINSWLENYVLKEAGIKKVGVIMAGNIPLVGLHDALCVLLSGNHLFAKLSSKDNSLMRWVLNCIQEIDPEFQERITITDSLKGIDNLIATGSDNSARYFDYYFKDKRRIIRKNRTSVAVIKGDESAEELVGLSHDVFTHFGLGCRNVTKIFLPKGYDLDKIFNAFYRYKEVINHNKYANNYDYNKAVYLLNQIELVENGFLLLKEDEGLHSPVGVLFYEYYSEVEEVMDQLKSEEEQIQCKVGNFEEVGFIPFGKAQQPELGDYADGVDTLEFLLH